MRVAYMENHAWSRDRMLNYGISKYYADRFQEKTRLSVCIGTDRGFTIWACNATRIALLVGAESLAPSSHAVIQIVNLFSSIMMPSLA